MKDLISREALREDFYELEIHGTMAVKAVLPIIEERIDNLPAVDAVKAVRCRNCKHCEDGLCYQPRIDALNGVLLVKETDFCSYGEPKTET